MDQSTKIPIIKLYDNLIVSIQVDLSDRVVIQLKEDITNAIMGCDATGLVLELSGIELMDSFITRSISDIGKTARLMGVETAVAGLNPMIAVTLVEMGMDFEGVHPALNLEAALEHLEEAKRERGLLDDDGDADRRPNPTAPGSSRSE